jgi:hypothetical protein
VSQDIPVPDDWPFDQLPNTAAITVRAIVEGDPILHVSHDEDDHGWQFLDGRDVVVEEGRLISMANALDLDPTLRVIADLPLGWIAWRENASVAWVREPHA